MTILWRSIFGRLFIAFVVTVVVTPAVRPQTASEGGAAAAVKMRSHGDERSVDVDEELQLLLRANRGLAGSVPRRPMTFGAALARLRELARSAGGDAALTPALKALPDNEPFTLRLLAVRELAQGRPTATLLLLLAAYDRDPSSPDALADLAGVLASLGYANEALAFLDELRLRNAAPSPPMGIDGADVLAYVRGYCLVRLGDTAAARPLLAGVVARQPMLAEAARLLAVISEDATEQRKALLLGVWRHRSPLTVSAGVNVTKDEPDPLQEGKNVAIDLRSLLDLSKGEPGRLPDVSYARSVLHANGLIPILEAAEADVDRQEDAVVEQTKAPRGIRHTDTDVIETWGYRMASVLRSLHLRDRKLRDLDRARRSANQDANKALREIVRERDKAVTEAQERWGRAAIARKATKPPTWDEMGEMAREAHEAALNRARGFVKRQEQAERDFFGEWHLLATALAGQVGDPAWREYWRLFVEAERLRSYSRLLYLAASHARVGEHPYITKEPGETPATPEAQEIGKCDDDNSMSFSTGSEIPGGKALPFEVGVEMTCEGMSAEIDINTRIPGLSVSSELGVDSKGDFTVFVGPKVGADIGNDLAAFSGSAKGGAYLTGNRAGIKGAGVKYEVKASGKIGAVSASRKLSEGAISFMPAPAGGDGANEPLMINGRR